MYSLGLLKFPSFYSVLVSNASVEEPHCQFNKSNPSPKCRKHITVSHVEKKFNFQSNSINKDLSTISQTKTKTSVGSPFFSCSSIPRPYMYPSR